VIGIRGAISIEKDSKEDVENAVMELLQAIFERNELITHKIVSMIFSVTSDIRSYNPATAARKKFGLSETPLMCLLEASFEDSPPRIIRVLIHYNVNSDFRVNHVYLRRAKDLRPDISSKKNFNFKGGVNQ